MVIGFINESYTALESDEEAFVDIGVISGSVQRDVIFELTFSNGSALGKLSISAHTYPVPQPS